VRFGELAEMHVLVDVEVHHHLVAVEVDRGHLAHAEAGDLHGGAGLQATCLREVSRIVVLGRAERELVVIECHNGDSGGQRHARQADDERIAFGEGLHFGAHRPVVCSASLT
jgi:hypothetical protein